MLLPEIGQLGSRFEVKRFEPVIICQRCTQSCDLILLQPPTSYQCIWQSHSIFSMTFTEDYGKVLSPFLKKYQVEENEKWRRAVLKNAAEAVVKSRDLLLDNLLKDIQTVPLSFFFFFPLFHNFFFASGNHAIFQRMYQKEISQRVGTPNQSRLNKYIVSGTLLNKIIKILFKMKFPTIQAISTTSAVTSGR